MAGGSRVAGMDQDVAYSFDSIRFRRSE